MPAIAAIDNETLDHLVKTKWNASERLLRSGNGQFMRPIVPLRSDSFCSLPVTLCPRRAPGEFPRRVILRVARATTAYGCFRAFSEAPQVGAA
jgi:hypothetical protein